MYSLADLKQTRVYQEAWEEGYREGVLMTGRELVENLLMLRFGEIPPQILQQIAAIQDWPLLKQCFEDAVLAGSIDEVAERFAVRLVGHLPSAELGET